MFENLARPFFTIAVSDCLAVIRGEKIKRCESCVMVRRSLPFDEVNEHLCAGPNLLVAHAQIGVGASSAPFHMWSSLDVHLSCAMSKLELETVVNQDGLELLGLHQGLSGGAG